MSPEARGRTRPRRVAVERTQDALIPLKARDAWWTAFAIDPLAGPLVRLATRFRRLTPNHFTAASAIVAVTSGVAFAAGWLIAGALLFQAAFVLDCIDGKLAGLQDRSTPWGGYLDDAADAVRFFAAGAGLTWHLLERADASDVIVLMAVVYMSARWAVLVLDATRPYGRPDETLHVSASPFAILAAAPRRLARPGSTVDGEAVVFTIGPLAGAVGPAIVLGAIAALLNLAYAIGRGIVQAHRSG